MDTDHTDDLLAVMVAPEDSRYVVICRDCRRCWPYKRDCKTTKAVRAGEASCPECGASLDMAADSKAG